MLKYIYEKFFQRFVIEDIARCLNSFEQQHRDILTNYCRCKKREYTYSTTNCVYEALQSVATGGSISTDNSFVQPQHYSCGDCGKPITEELNKENT